MERAAVPWVLTAIRSLLLLLALAGVAVTSLPAFNGDRWWIRVLDFPRIEFLIAMAAVALLLVLLPRRTWLSWVAVVALAGACAYDAVLLAPYSPLVAPQQIATQSCPDGNRLRLLEANVQMTNEHDHRLLDIVRQVAPDVAWFQETDSWWEQELTPLGAEMPYGVAKAQPNYFGVHLFSKLPLSDSQVHYLTDSRNPSVFASVRLPSGETVKLYAIHPRPPLVGQSTAERDGQLLAAALAARDDPAPHVIAGDINSVPWEGVIGRTQRVGRVLDPRIGQGLYVTWNAKSPVLKWPLDQILPGPGFTLLSLQVLPAFGSDHRPYLAELCLDPAAAPRQPPPALLPGDVEAAQATVRDAQDAADKVGHKGRDHPGGARMD
jgi:endonuclease/exonuclease/phosphatase (EEP) superfamily protein YafD